MRWGTPPKKAKARLCASKSSIMLSERRVRDTVPTAVIQTASRSRSSAQSATGSTPGSGCCSTSTRPARRKQSSAIPLRHNERSQDRFHLSSVDPVDMAERDPGDRPLDGPKAQVSFDRQVCVHGPKRGMRSVSLQGEQVAFGPDQPQPAAARSHVAAAAFDAVCPRA
jgi:hypothetical protein